PGVGEGVARRNERSVFDFAWRAASRRAATPCGPGREGRDTPALPPRPCAANVSSSRARLHLPRHHGPRPLTGTPVRTAREDDETRITLVGEREYSLPPGPRPLPAGAELLLTGCELLLRTPDALLTRRPRGGGALAGPPLPHQAAEKRQGHPEDDQDHEGQGPHAEDLSIRPRAPKSRRGTGRQHLGIGLHALPRLDGIQAAGGVRVELLGARVAPVFGTIHENLLPLGLSLLQGERKERPAGLGDRVATHERGN